MKTGICYGIGIGAGGAELITLAAAKVLTSVPLLITIRAITTNGGGKSDIKFSRCRQIIEQHWQEFPRGFFNSKKNHNNLQKIIMAEPIWLELLLPMQRGRVGDTMKYQNLLRPHIKTIINVLNAGKDVAFLCEGDGLFYGSLQYMFGLLPKNYSLKIISGIAAPFFAAAKGSSEDRILSLGSGDSILTIIPATLPEFTLKKKFQQKSENFVIIKLGRHVVKVRKILDELGLLPKARLFLELGRSDEEIMMLSQWHGETLPYFSLILITE